MRRLAPMGAITLLVFIGAVAPLSAHADLGQSVADVVTDPLIGADWSQGLGVGLSGTLTQASFPIRFTRSPYYGPKFFFGLDACDDAQYQQCHSSITWGYSSSSISPNGTPDIPTDATLSFSIPEGYQFDANKYYVLHVGISPNNGGGSLQVYGSAADTLPGESTNAPNMSDLAFTLTGISYTGTTTPPAQPSGVVLNHAIGGNVIHAPNYVSGGIPEGVGIPYSQLDSVPGGDYWVVVFFAQSAGCPSSNYVMNMFQPGAYWGYETLPDGFHKAMNTAGGGCMQQFRIRPEGQRSPSWYFGALSNTGMEDGLGDANGIQAFAVCYDQASCDAVQRPTVAQPAGVSSILFLPGIEGSRLYENLNGIENKRWELSLQETQTDAKSLYLDASGHSLHQLYTKPGDAVAAISTPIGGFDVYRTFFEQLKGMRDAHTIADYLVFAYDWRMNPIDVVEQGTPYQDGTHYLDQELLSLASTSQTGKVTIVAHSNGGLVTKALMNKLVATGHADKVDKIIFVDVPQLGTPMAIQSILHGDFSPYSGLLLSPQNARGLGINMPDAFALLPATEYFNRVATPVIDLTQAPKLRAASGVTTNVISDEVNFQKFMTTLSGRPKPDYNDTDTPEVLSNALFEQAKTMHSVLDSWTPPAGVQVIQIAGWGRATASGVAYSEKQSFKCLLGNSFCPLGVDLQRIPITVEDGDDTVVIPSQANNLGKAFYINLPQADKAAGKNWGHGDITESTPFQQLFSLILSTTTPNALPNYVSDTQPAAGTGKKIQIRVHSPVSIDVYDTAGRHTGRRENPGSDLLLKEELIPNSSYEEFGEEKFVDVPNEPGNVIKLKGLDTGTFTLDVITSEGGSSKTVVYSDLPVTPSLLGTVTTSQDTSISPTLSLDINGDGSNDTAISSPATTENPLAYLKVMRASVSTMDMGTSTKLQLTARLNNIEHLILKDSKWDSEDDDNDAKDIKKNERIEARILRKLDKIDAYITRILSKPAPKRPKQERISEAQASAILNMNAHLKTLIK